MDKSPIHKRQGAFAQNDQPLSQETIRALQELGVILSQIHRRLTAKGYVIKDGQVIKPEERTTHNGVK